MRELELYQIKFLFNDTQPPSFPDWLQSSRTEPVMRYHQSLPEYRPTPLLPLDKLAAAGGVRSVLIKNEAERFGLNAFKALGSSWAIAALLAQRAKRCAELAGGEQLTFAELTRLTAELSTDNAADQITFCTATDGNHGRGVAWAAQLLGCPAHIFMPAGAEPERVQAIAALGAQVEQTGLSYDETVALASRQAEANGWLLVQDTSLPGYTETPKLIIQGYSTIAAEISQQLQQNGLPLPTHIFLQAGVGSMAGGLLAYLSQMLPNQPKFIILEPKPVACCYLAAQKGDPAAAVPGVQETIMAGLNCGTPCSLIMPLLLQQAHCFMACPDFVAAHGMRLAVSGEPSFISGESGAVALGAIALLLQQPQLAAARAQLGIDQNSVLLGINTEGAMAPSVWQKIVRDGAYPLPH